MDEFKQGLITSLWDCDHCNYSLDPEDIEIYDEDDYFTIIKLKLK
jgi:type II restriction/modification system DNA methylase subunit YeeA